MHFRQLVPLVFLVVLAQSIFAVSGCSDIQVNTFTVRLGQERETAEYFFVENRGTERFFIDASEASDTINGIIVSPNGFDRAIDAFGIGNVGVRVRALKSAPLGVNTAIVRVRGHFLSGRECAFQDIGTKEFKIAVEESTIDYGYVRENRLRACTGVVVSNPADFVLEDGTMELQINNYTGFRTNIFVSGEGLTINPHSISVPERSFVRERIFISTPGTESWLYFNISNPFCEGLERTRVIKATAPVQEKLSDAVNLGANVFPNDRNFSALVSLENKSGREINGKILFDIPGEWLVQGTQEITIPAHEEISREFYLVPLQPLSGETDGKARFVSGTEELSVPFTVKAVVPAQPNALTTAFFALFSNASGVLLVIAVLAVLLWLFAEGRKRARTDAEDKLLFTK